MLTSTKHLPRLFRGPLLLALVVLGRASSAQQATVSHQLSDFAGVWVRTIHHQIFLVLSLKLNAGKLEGTLSRPRHFSDVSGDGTTVTDPETVVVPILNVAVAGSALHFATPDPSGVGELEKNTLVLWDTDSASLAYGDYQDMPRWILKKNWVPELPKVSKVWPSDKEQTYPPEVVAVQKQLHAMVQVDQDADMPPYTHFKEVCEQNFPVVEGLFRRYGWLKQSAFGKQTASDFWLLSAHQADAHPKFAQEELSAMRAAVSEGEATAATYALFFDSVARAQGRPQHWGTKTVCENGERRPYTIDDMQGLDRRRDEALLPPEGSYISSLPPCSQ